MISASHNPYQDNGIKFLRGDGRKLSDGDESAIEALMERPRPLGGGSVVGARRRGRIRTSPGWSRTSATASPRDLRSGSTAPTAPPSRSLRRCSDALGEPVAVIGDAPGRSQHQPGRRLHASGGGLSARGRCAACGRVSPSTATPTAAWRWTRPGARSTVMRSSRCSQSTAAGAGCRTPNGGGDVDDESRVPPADARARRRGEVTDVGDRYVLAGHGRDRADPGRRAVWARGRSHPAHHRRRAGDRVVAAGGVGTARA